MKTLKLLAALAAFFISANALALPQNLPHYNRSDVDDAVKIYIPYSQFSVDANLVSNATGAPVVQEINGTDISGVRMDATGDTVVFNVPLPDNTCVDCQIKVSTAWSTSSVVTTATATWAVTYKAIAAGEALTAASTALDTAITADTVSSTQFALNESPQGIIAAGTLSRSDMLVLAVELDATQALNPATAQVYLNGIYLEYYREKL